MFDKADSDRIRQSLLDYERAAVTEWPVAASGHSFPEADNALQRLYTAYTQVQPRTDIQTKFLATSLGNLDKMSQARTERVLQARTDVGPPWSLWAVIFVTSGLLLGGAIVYGVEKPVKHCNAVDRSGWPQQMIADVVSGTDATPLDRSRNLLPGGACTRMFP